MVSRVHSQKCLVCSNMVRYDNPTFPYCRFHAHLAKDSLSLMKRDNQHSFESNRNILYKPEMARVPRSQMTKQAVIGTSKGTGLEDKSVLTIASAWSKATRGIDAYNPRDCFENMDVILHQMLPVVKDTLEKDSSVVNPHTSIAECKNSSITMPDGKMRDLKNNHQVIYSSSDNNATVIVDVAPAAALHGLIDNKDDLEKSFPYGHTSFTDGMSLCSLYEFSDYSGINVDQVVDLGSGEVLWDNNTGIGKDSSEISSQRDILKSSPKIVFPETIRRRSPTDEDLEKEKRKQEEKSYDDELERLFAEDMGL